GDRIKEKIGDIVLKPGDTLMILANKDFIDLWYNKRDFFLVSRSADVESKPKIYSYLSLIVLVLMIVMMAFQVVPVLLAVSTASIILIISGTISPYSARNSVDWKVILVIASAFGIAKGMLNSGVASFLADKLIMLSDSMGPIGMIAMIYFTTSFYTEIITNNAAAALIVPVAISVSGTTGVDPVPLMITVAVAASASFATPIGYQTNLMVYGPGGYKFRDFLKIGIPMNLIMGVIAILLIYFIYF
ncbi:MAG: anion permease, partial [Candidatus Aminicenantes bacterium]|nr:anion permease [Candidatus Aminicenantes bacterium]